jgi:hypothetical protein
MCRRNCLSRGAPPQRLSIAEDVRAPKPSGRLVQQEGSIICLKTALDQQLMQLNMGRMTA